MGVSCSLWWIKRALMVELAFKITQSAVMYQAPSGRNCIAIAPVLA